MQPNRYILSGYLMLVLPASMGVAAIVDSFHARAGGRLAGRYLATANLGIILLATAFYVNEVRREILAEPIGHYGATPPEVRGVGRDTYATRAWLDRNTDTNGRILFEITTGNRLDKAQISASLS